MPKGKNKQLDLSDRLFIEDRMRLRDSFSEIARRLGVSPSTVSREVERNRVPHSPAYQACRENLCFQGRRVRGGGPVRDRVPGAVQEVQEGSLDLQRAVPGLRAQALPAARPPAVLLQRLPPQVRGRPRAPHALLRRPVGRRACPQEAL